MDKCPKCGADDYDSLNGGHCHECWLKELVPCPVCGEGIHPGDFPCTFTLQIHLQQAREAIRELLEWTDDYYHHDNGDVQCLPCQSRAVGHADKIIHEPGCILVNPAVNAAREYK